jgi:tetratricopeptide (TPR) repeat protein
MGKKTVINYNESELEDQVAKAVKEHDAVAAALNFFSFLAPSGIPLCYVTPCKSSYPEPLSSLSDSEWERLFKVLDAHGLVLLGRSELCLLPYVQDRARLRLDALTADGFIQAGVQFISSIFADKGSTRLDEISRMAWHTAVLAGWAIEAGMKEQLEPLLDLLDWEGRVLIDAWPDRAIISHLRGIQLCKTLKGESHSGVAIRINNLGQAWHRLGEFERAETYLQRALSRLEKKFGSHHQLVANLLGNLALLRRDKRQIDEAADYFKRALALVDNDHGLENQLVNLCVNGLGRIIKNRQGAEVAAEFLAESLEKSVSASGIKYHPNIAMVFNNLGLLQLEAGHKDMARRSFGVAMNIARRSLPQNHPLHRQIFINRKPLDAG